MERGDREGERYFPTYSFPSMGSRPPIFGAERRERGEEKPKRFVVWVCYSGFSFFSLFFTELATAVVL